MVNPLRVLVDVQVSPQLRATKTRTVEINQQLLSLDLVHEPIVCSPKIFKKKSMRTQLVSLEQCCVNISAAPILCTDSCVI